MQTISTAVVFLVMALGGGAASALAQPSPARPATIAVTGAVQDASGAPLASASIEAMVAGLPVATASTGPDGRYRIELAPGTPHQLRARMTGFADAIVDLRTAASPASLDFILRIAALSDTIVVTAARLPESRAGATASIAVFTQRDIAALGSPSLADIVRTVPGLNVESNGREGAVASLFSRGGESDYNLVLIDGVRVNQNGGTFDFSRVSGSEIDRLEVVRGAQSSLYGSDAIGSVVQVMTRRATPGDPPQVVGSLEGGSFRTRRGDAHVIGGARRRIDYHVGGTYRSTEGAFHDILPEHDRFEQTTVDGGVGAILGDRATLRTGLRYANGKGKGIGQIAYGDRDTGTVANTRDLSWHVDFAQRISPRINQQATFAYYRSSRLSADTIENPTYQVQAILEGTPGAMFPDSPRLVRLIDGPTFAAFQSGAQALGAGQFLATTTYGVGDYPFSSESELRRPAFRYQADVTWADSQVLSGGYDYERETDPLHPDFLAQNNAFFVQQRFNGRDRWFGTLGARVERNSRYGTSGSPKAGLGGFPVPYRSGPVSSAKVFANVGRGIKNPTFGELYGSAYTDGNPNLNPERARTIDAGIETTFDSQRFLVRATWFDNRYDNQVAFNFSGSAGDGKPDFVNIDGSEAKGLELEGALQKPVAGGFTASAGYALVDTKVVAAVSTSEQFQPGQPLLRRPKHSATLRLAYGRGRALVNVNVQYVGQRHDAAFLGLSAVPSARFPTGRSVDVTVNPAYTLIWLGGDVRLAHGASLFARIDNLGDAAYESALGYPGLPRSAVVGVRFNVGAGR